jgi:general secretion pathway protein L
MSLSGAFGTAVDDLVALATPLVARSSRATRLVAVAEGEALALYEIPAKGEPRRLPDNAKRRGDGPVELRLPADAVLTRRLTLPAAGRDFLDPIIEHRLERLVPWSAERALYGCNVAGETDAGEIEVEFAATSRDIADKWLAKAEAAGLSPTAIGGSAGPIERPLEIDLWRGGRDRVQARARRLVSLAAGIAALVVLPTLALSIYTSYAAEQRLAEIENRSAAARRVLAEAAGAGQGSREAALIAAKRPDDAMATLVDRLARAIPQDTALRDLEIDEARLRMAGTSAASPGLIGRLEASGLTRETRFAAPVTRAPDGRDNFEILAQRVRPERPGQPAAPSAAPNPEPGL